MRKPTRKTKRRNRICSRKAYHHQISRRNKKEGRKRSRKRFKHRKTELQCPEIFSLDSNFDEVVSALAEVREQSKVQRNKSSEQVFILLQNIQEISPAGALVLVAEIFRWTKIPTARRLKAASPSQWNPEVRKLLNDMGFFELLGLGAFAQMNTNNEGIRYVKFRTGKKSDGEAPVELLTDDLEPLVGEMPDNHYLYAAVTEAMTNVRQHAYQHDRVVTNWWLSASHHAEKEEVRILVYDQGSGIPGTLPKKLTQDVVSILRNDHAGLIEKAHDLARSASKEEHRGHGLKRDVRGYLERLNCCGYYRVISLRGEYTYKKLASGTSAEKHNHDNPLKGTLIEWSLTLPNE